MYASQPLTRAWYRVRQFRRAMGARPEPDAAGLLAALLTPGEQRLFRRLAPRDQHHSLETLRLLGGADAVPRYLARAALLHDAGKGYIHLHERVAYVLLAAGAPRLLTWLAQPQRRGPRGALYRIHHHAPHGARLLAQLGADPREIELIARHHQPPGPDAELRALIHADDRA